MAGMRHGYPPPRTWLSSCSTHLSQSVFPLCLSVSSLSTSLSFKCVSSSRIRHEDEDEDDGEDEEDPAGIVSDRESSLILAGLPRPPLSALRQTAHRTIQDYKTKRRREDRRTDEKRERERGENGQYGRLRCDGAAVHGLAAARDLARRLHGPDGAHGDAAALALRRDVP
ncbi:hypothetical protein TRV_07867 [Trichophyton verrucosum HKI 0517]|uniref:Uncharacterized protein n=1 Tax=Trichophyton verrucosum (strain HKI 0517) TaxID=663202 RepID=D4DKZ3_TRIVH|nr:uncharacterized protein TRV_07867 [Trichophyton verrucosum HKI 0517]EFE37526.1 hypothetical protein TRV_07867 [Trichophyton verrucosum HKI 0517]